jgi:hypothetical protein
MIYRGSGSLSSVSKPPARRHIGRQRKKDNLMSGEGGKRVGEEPNQTTSRKPGPL